MYKMSTKHVFLYFHCIGDLYSLLYISTKATFYIILQIVKHNKKYNKVCGIAPYNLSRSLPIKVYN